jgi:hypothetical protein
VKARPALLKITCGVMLAAGLGLQFIRPEKNLSPAGPGPDDLLVLHPAPPEIATLLHRACYDCHSNHTRYPWYAEIQPVGWWLADHVQEGKKHFNFSTFGAASAKRQARKLAELIDEVTAGNMPLASYQLAHAEARLSAAEVEALVAWAEGVGDGLLEP